MCAHIHVGVGITNCEDAVSSERSWLCSPIPHMAEEHALYYTPAETGDLDIGKGNNLRKLSVALPKLA